jgi:hypothetical protein
LQVDNDIPSVESIASANPIFDASTPLPKPTEHLRHSTSVTFSNKRSSCLVTRRTSAMNWSAMTKVKEADYELDNTPTGALKRLTGSVNVEPTNVPATIACMNAPSLSRPVREPESLSQVKEPMRRSLPIKEMKHPSQPSPAAALFRASSGTEVDMSQAPNLGPPECSERDGERWDVAAILTKISDQIESLGRGKGQNKQRTTYADGMIEELYAMQRRSLQREAALRSMLEEASTLCRALNDTG